MDNFAICVWNFRCLLLNGASAAEWFMSLNDNHLPLTTLHSGLSEQILSSEKAI